MPSVRINHDVCLCGSGAVIAKCCLRSIGNVMPKTDDRFSHANCYANAFGTCSTTISGEHWISANLLRANDPRFVTLRGAAWQNGDEEKKLPIDVLKSKMLCTRHNSALSPWDVLAGRFFAAFPSIKKSSTSPQHVSLFVGVDFERWMLNTLCGGLCAQFFRPASGPPGDWTPPKEWLEFIDGGNPLASRIGLYFCQKPGDWVRADHAIVATPLSIGGVVLGVELQLHGMSFVLIMADPD